MNSQRLIVKVADVPGRARYRQYTSRRGSGQTKLYLGTLLFLAEAAPEITTATKPVVVLYVGSAPGNSIPVCASILKGAQWHLYDPREHAPEVERTPNVVVHKRLFAVDDFLRCVRREDVFLVFISDIRHSTDRASVAQDNELQSGWVEALRPDVAWLKFRIPYPAQGDRHEPYSIVLSQNMRADLYLQVYSKTYSAETRLLLREGHWARAVLSVSAQLEIEERLFYYNLHVRTPAFERAVRGEIQRRVAEIYGYSLSALESTLKSGATTPP